MLGTSLSCRFAGDYQSLDRTLTRSATPSAIRHPEVDAYSVIAVLNQHESDLSSGALVVVEENRSRVRVLPI